MRKDHHAYAALHTRATEADLESQKGVPLVQGIHDFLQHEGAKFVRRHRAIIIGFVLINFKVKKLI